MKILVSILCFLALQPLKAQTFSAAPAPVLLRELALNEANECYIYFDHPAMDTLHLKWRQLEMSLPEGWTADLCDYGLCYTGIPANGTMNPAYDTIRPYLKLIVQPGTTAGNGWLWFRAIDIVNTANYLDVYFSLFTPGTVGLVNPEISVVRMFPNPASGFVFLQNKTLNDAPGRLSDFSGKTVWQGVLSPQTTQNIDLTPYPNGIYFLQTSGKTERLLIQK